MVNFFDRIYSSINDKNKLLSKLRYYSGLRFIVRLSANIILPVYFIITRNNRGNYLNTCSKTKGRIIVSLTSFPARIGRLWLVIETILRQTKQPDKIILWLSEEQFTSLKTIPKNLARLQRRGLEICFCKGDLRSHKKYYYALQKFPEDILITIDDDVFYNSRIIEYLMHLYQKYPSCVCCNRCSEIGISDKQIQPYILWKDFSLSESPSYKIFSIGIGGVLYPSGIFDSEVSDSEIFMKYCPTADDIWLNTMVKLAGKMVVKSNYNSSYLPVINLKDSTLASMNVNEGMNDMQFASIRKYCFENLGVDPFQKLIEQ